MAKIVFISLSDSNTEGLRSLSAVLKHNNHEPYIVFLKRYCHSEKTEEGDWVSIRQYGTAFNRGKGPEITFREKEILLSLLKDIKPGLIGFSVTAPFRKRAEEISKLIKARLNIPIIWGGPGAMTSVEECLTGCDFVCVGEGERTILEIASLLDQERDIKGAGNLAYIEDGKVRRNPLYPLISDLDSLPLKDISSDNKFLIEYNALINNFDEVSYSERHTSKNHTYHIISSRGCPYSCSYCCESYFKKLYFPENFLRRRSPARVIKELKEAKRAIDYKMVQFEDEVFSFDYNWLEQFARMYKEEIRLPFRCYIFPNNDIERQLKILKETGLVRVTLSLQSGSERINRDVFNRVFNKELFLKTANLLKAMKIDWITDVITFNPFEEEKDLQATMDILSELPKPFYMNVNKLYIIKGTKMYDMVASLKDNKQKRSLPDAVFLYYSRLFWLANRHNKCIVKLAERMKIFRYLIFLLDFSPRIRIPSLK